MYIYSIDTDLMCYYCRYNAGECNEDEYGELIKCQDDDEHSEHFGNACYIGHTGKHTPALSILHVILNYLWGEEIVP